MVRIEFQPPDLDPILRVVATNERLRRSFLKNWANAAAMDARANARAKGGRRYWSDLARSIQVRRVSERAEEVSSSQIGAGLKQFGGTVRPKHAKALTIPIVPEAKGKTAYELERPDRPLFVVSEATGDPETVGVLGYAKKSRKGDVSSFHPLFVLRRKAQMRPEPWFPTAQRIAELANREARIVYNKELKNWNTQQT